MVALYRLFITLLIYLYYGNQENLHHKEAGMNYRRKKPVIVNEKNQGRDSESIRRFRKAQRVILWIIVGILLVITVFSSAYTVREQEQAVVLTFGKPTAVTSSGLHFKAPFIQTIKKVNTTIQGFPIGYNEFTSQTTREAAMITRDFNFVNVDFFVEWRVTDPIKSLYRAQRPVEILSTMVQSSARNVIGTTDVESVLTTGKGEIQSRIRESVSASLYELDIGLQLVNVIIQDSEPPTEEVFEAFKSVENAKQAMDTEVNNANRYRNEQIPNARAKSDEILQEAEADKQARINDARGQVARFNEMFAEYRRNPEITRKRLFFEAMEEILPGMKVVIEGHGNIELLYPVDAFDASGG